MRTTGLRRVHRVAPRFEAGAAWVSDWAMREPAVPFGCVRQSGYGRESGPEALEVYTGTESVVVSLV